MNQVEKGLSLKIRVLVLLVLVSIIFVFVQMGCDGQRRFARQEMGERGYHWNCGLNVAYISLKLFGQEVDINDLAKDLDAGAYFERDVSMLRLKQALERRGLIVEGFRADSTKEIIRFANSENVLILRMGWDRNVGGTGHFILIKACGKDIIRIDPPRNVERFAKENELTGKFLANATGEFLVISKEKEHAGFLGM